MNSGAKGQDLACELEEVDNLSRDDLVQHWQKHYGCLPPKGVKRQLLERAYLHHQQERRYGEVEAGHPQAAFKSGSNRFETPINPVSKPALT